MAAPFPHRSVVRDDRPPWQLRAIDGCAEIAHAEPTRSRSTEHRNRIYASGVRESGDSRPAEPDARKVGAPNRHEQATQRRRGDSERKRVLAGQPERALDVERCRLHEAFDPRWDAELDPAVGQ